MPNILKNPRNLTPLKNKVASFIDRSIAATKLPAGLTSLGNYAFAHCANLALTALPEDVTNIENYAFFNCTNLKSLSIGKNIQTIGSGVFNNCSNLTSITINRVKDAVTGAPWGATNATVTWTGTT